MEKISIISYGVLAFHTLQNSAYKDMKIKDIDIDYFASEMDTMIKVYPREVAIQKYMNLARKI